MAAPITPNLHHIALEGFINFFLRSILPKALKSES